MEKIACESFVAEQIAGQVLCRSSVPPEQILEWIKNRNPCAYVQQYIPLYKRRFRYDVPYSLVYVNTVSLIDLP